ncbi:MAG: carboxypeptidase-like regulatory domain-containing protein [Promethearchaeota archaeon]
MVTPIIFSGYVKSTSKKPVSGAEVQINEMSVKTDQRGYFRIVKYYTHKETVPDRFILNITKEGFALLSKIYRTGIENRTWFLTKAFTKKIDPRKTNTIVDSRHEPCMGSLSSQVDWIKYKHRRTPRRKDKKGKYITDDSDEAKKAIEFAENANQQNEGISVTIPANSLVDLQGKPPVGDVLVTVSTVDIYDPDSMPGNYTVDLGEGRMGYMETFGAGSIRIMSQGKEYQLKEKAEATLKIPINRYQLQYTKDLEEYIPVLYYDEKKGLWKKEKDIMAKLDSKKEAYVAKINHFSHVNYDIVKDTPACIILHTPNLPDNYDLELTIIPRTYCRRVNNLASPDKTHTICRLPPDTDIQLKAFAVDTCGLTGEERIVISDPITVHTGPTQRVLNPYCPEHDELYEDPENPGTELDIWQICHNVEDTLDPLPLGPIIQVVGDPEPACPHFQLRWEYEPWDTTPAHSEDHFDLEESETGEDDDFHVIWQTKYGEHPPQVIRKLTRPSGDWWYRVIAKSVEDGDSEYSDKVCVNLDPIGAAACLTPQPTSLKVINDLTPDEVDPEGVWTNRVIGIKASAVIPPPPLGWSAVDDRYADDEQDPPPPPDFLLPNIPPKYNSDDNSEIVDLPPDVRALTGGQYYVYIQIGHWEPNTAGDKYLKKHELVIDCDGNPNTPKSRVITIETPFQDPQVVRLSEHFPYGDYEGHFTCPE